MKNKTHIHYFYYISHTWLVYKTAIKVAGTKYNIVPQVT